MQLADIVYQGVPFLKEMGLVYKITSPWYMKLCGTQVFKVESLIPQHSMHIIMVLHVTFVMEKLALRNANLNDTYLTSIVHVWRVLGCFCSKILQREPYPSLLQGSKVELHPLTCLTLHPPL